MNQIQTEMLKQAPTKTDFVVDDEFIRKWMSADEIFRGRHGKGLGWPLLEGTDLLELIALFRCSTLQTAKPMTTTHNRNHQSQGFKNNLWEPLTEDLAVSWKHIDPKNRVDRILELGRGHLIVAGGSVARAFYGSQFRIHVSDYDFFFVGLNPDEIKKAQEILRDVINFLHLQNKEYDEEVEEGDKGGHFLTWTDKAVTVKLVGYWNSPYQFILRLYPNVGDHKTNISLPIGGFDLHSCAVARALDENGVPQFYATHAGALSLGLMMNVLMTSRMSTSMIPRLSKYMWRGFDIYFPGTTKAYMKSLPTKTIFESFNICDDYMNVSLPHISVHVSSNTILPVGEQVVHTSDYDIELYEYEHKGQIANLKKMMAGRSELYVEWTDDPKIFWNMVDSGRELLDVETALRDLRGMIINRHMVHRVRYHIMEKRFIRYAWYFGKIFREVIREDIVKNDQVYLKLMTKVKEFESLVKSGLGFDRELGNARIECDIRLRREITIQIVKFAWLEGEEFTIQLDVYLRRMLESAKIAQAKVMTTRGLQWNTKNPLTQMTASNNPTVENPRSWWGCDAYTSFMVGFPDEIYWLCRLACIQNIGSAGKSIFKDFLVVYFARAWACGVIEPVLNESLERNSEFREILTKRTKPKTVQPLPRFPPVGAGEPPQFAIQQTLSPIQLRARFPVDQKNLSDEEYVYTDDDEEYVSE